MQKTDLFPASLLSNARKMSFVMAIGGWYYVDKGKINEKIGCEIFGR